MHSCVVSRLPSGARFEFISMRHAPVFSQPVEGLLENWNF
ncbi:hypothetical protein CEV34_0518 [Brucella pseudogrignonensis]|uniref:Uncharacterized protein n=1 Tax=Brucella pseudogrignonensis TaxID=419475 RepID=A0A256GUK1_9HYPH|nr:hypothetical protein CEV34_0518 [Brucella pseudogrignonensis]